MPSLIGLLPCCTLFSTTYFPSHFHPLWHQSYLFKWPWAPWVHGHDSSVDNISQISCPSSNSYIFCVNFQEVSCSAVLSTLWRWWCPDLDWALSSKPSLIFFYCFAFPINHCMKKHQDQKHHYPMDLNLLLFSWKYAFISFCTYAVEAAFDLWKQTLGNNYYPHRK